MLAIELPRTEVEPLLAARVGKLEIAAINSPTATEIFGESEALDAFVTQLQQQHPHIFYKELPVNYAFHSQQMACFAQTLVETYPTSNPKQELYPFSQRLRAINKLVRTLMPIIGVGISVKRFALHRL